MDVGPLRQVFVGDLHHRADHHERPVGPHLGDLVEQLGVEALVDHAVEAEPRPRQVFLVGRVELARARLGEMRAVDRRREAMDVVVAVLLRLVEARSAGEDDVGAVDQLLLELEQLRRRELELRRARPSRRRRSGRRRCAARRAASSACNTRRSAARGSTRDGRRAGAAAPPRAASSGMPFGKVRNDDADARQRPRASRTCR